MIDINFYRQFDNIVEKITSEKIEDTNKIFELLEEVRSKEPIVYNIETTNRCNMKCQMCPRTTLMTRKIQDLKKVDFEKIVSQLKPHSENSWQQWKLYCEKKYGIYEYDKPSENHFFLYIISKAIQLHGFGEPVLDPNLPYYIKLLNDKGIPTYFSTNPINIDETSTISMMANGLTYLKYCFDSIDDFDNKNIRGKKSDFTQGYKKVLRIIEARDKMKLGTTIVITMINLNKASQEYEYKKLEEFFKDKDIYLYLKSENSQWYRKNFHGTKAIHGVEICKHPWMSITIKSNGEVAMCMDDYNNEIILGDATKTALQDIWNDKKYIAFRKSHINGTCEKCEMRCDIPTINSYLKRCGE